MTYTPEEIADWLATNHGHNWIDFNFKRRNQSMICLREDIPGTESARFQGDVDIIPFTEDGGWDWSETVMG